MDKNLKYRRILLKFSGEVLRDGTTGECISPDVVVSMARKVKAAVDRVRALGHKSRAEGRRKAARRNPEATGSITVHLKGLSISLTREDANALAEELISQL